MADPGPTFSTLRIGETIHVKAQAKDQDAEDVRGSIGSIEVSDASTDVITCTDAALDASAGTSEANVNGIASGLKSIQATSGGVPPDDTQPVVVLNASRLVVNEDNLITIMLDAGDEPTIQLDVTPVDARHEAGATEPTYTCTEYLWTSDVSNGGHGIQFDNGSGPEATGTIKNPQVIVGSLDASELAANLLLKLNVQAKNSAMVVITGYVNLKLRQMKTFDMVIVTA